MLPLLLPLLSLAAPLRAQTPAAPPVSLTVSDDLGEAAYRPRLTLFGETLEVEPVAKAGALALTESFPYPYPILKRSPFAMGGLALTYHGVLDARAAGTLGAVDLRTERFSSVQGVESLYLDVGKVFALSESWKGALYAAFDQFSFGPIGGGDDASSDGIAEGSVGTSLLRKSGAHEASFTAALGGEGAPRSGYRNTSGDEVALFARQAVDYAYGSGPVRWLAGLEARESRAQDGIRPYVGLESEELSMRLAADMKRGKQSFYPDSAGAAATASARLSKTLTLGMSGRYESRSYPMAPAPVRELRFGTELTWTPGAAVIVRSAKSWGVRAREEYDAAKKAEMNASVGAAERIRVRDAIADAPTLEGFYESYKARSTMDILSAASELTALFNKYNYNDTEGKPENLESVAEIYARTRGSYLADAEDPTLVCLGAAQSAAAIAEEMGRRAGVPIQASAITVKSQVGGRAEGHAAAQIKTKEYGIVWADWGELIPTYTWDTERALRVYQSIVGLPALFHEVTDAGKNGRHVGYLFTEEGKLYVGTLTAHGQMEKPANAKLFGDAPRGADAAAERWRRLLLRP